jgi:hypothetical protein
MSASAGSSKHGGHPAGTVLHHKGEVPAYFECPVCGFLTAEPRFGDGDLKCPKCGAAPEGRRMFPAERIRRLDARVRRYHDEGEDEIVVILGETFLETLLEDVLTRILAAHGADVPVQHVVLDATRSVGQRLSRLFPALTGKQFEDAAAEAGCRDFPYRWRKLREVRNSFIHDAPFASTPTQLERRHSDEAMVLLDEAYHLFVLINNRFVAEERAHRLHLQ